MSRKAAKGRIKPCEECRADSEPGERYCKRCRKVVLAQLDAAGYLTPKVWTRPYREPDKRAATTGDPDPWQEDAIRAMEEFAGQLEVG